MLSTLIVTALFILAIVGYTALARAKGWGTEPYDGYGGDAGSFDGGDGAD
jgi:hypothetical protein